MNSLSEIRLLLQAFQDGYTRRDMSAADAFMELFTPDAQVIGTNGIKPGTGEWYTTRAAAGELVRGDWKGWGDLRLDLETAAIQAQGDVGWIAAYATVTEIIGAENYGAYLEYVMKLIESSGLTAEQKLRDILRGGTNTVYELERGETFIWPLRWTAVVVRENNRWRFSQMHFSFPTTHFPDVRF